MANCRVTFRLHGPKHVFLVDLFSSKNSKYDFLLDSSPVIMLETLTRPMYLGSFVRKHF